jgi:hypothetical protein
VAAAASKTATHASKTESESITSTGYVIPQFDFNAPEVIEKPPDVEEVCFIDHLFCSQI